MGSGLVGKKVSHQQIKVAELTADPEALKKFVSAGDGKYVLTQVVAGKDWGIGTIWKLVLDADGPVLARVFEGSAPEGLRIIDEAATGQTMVAKTASLAAPAADVTERMASGITTGDSMDQFDQNVAPIVLDWVEAGLRPSSPAVIAKAADTMLAKGRVSPEEARQIKANAVSLFKVASNYIEAKNEALFDTTAPGTEKAAAGPLDRTISSLLAYKPKGMDIGKFASVLKNLLAAAEEKKDDKPGDEKKKVKVKIKNIDTQGGDVVVVPPQALAAGVPPQFQKKDEGENKPSDKKDEKKSDDKKDNGKKDEGKKLPPWLEKKKDA